MGMIRTNPLTTNQLEKTRAFLIKATKDPITKDRLAKASMDDLVYFCAVHVVRAPGVEHVAAGFFGSTPDA